MKDGLRYIRSKENEYDLIIVDSTDPFGPGEGLFTKEFYGNCFKALTEDGILVNQHENAYYTSFAQSMRRAHCRIVNLFPICKVYQAHIPTYPSGHWLFGFASKKYDPVADLKADAWNRLRSLPTIIIRIYIAAVLHCPLISMNYWSVTYETEYRNLHWL